jgi:hypothetical protein
MSSSRIDSTRATLTVEPTRERQTTRPGTPFRNVLAGGVDVLMAGAEIATSVVGGPVLAAAVHGARNDVVGGIGGGPPPAPGGAALPPTGGAGSELAEMHAMQRESQAFNMQLLSLQEDVQQENRRFTTLSNVLRAKHDTAKAAVSNIRS